ncbi:MAG: TonB-dependent receptor [Halioglobus sp.]|nr:TonB-dependent receptor [Halioglobus sp.]
MNKLSSATLLALSSVTAVSAQASNKLEETVVTSSRVVMPLREVATSISVITADEIQIRGFSTVADTLRYEPAISVTSNGGAGTPTDVRIRGESGFRTKVYIDGIDITDNSATQAGPNFGNLLSGGIERIEILRGPEGLSYGADAGGVINMYTATPQPGLSGGFGVEGGRYGTWQYNGHVSGGTEVVDGAAIVERYESDGFNTKTTDTVLQDDDSYDNTTVHGRTGWNISKSLRAELVGRSVEGKGDYDTCFLGAPTYLETDDCKQEYDQDFGRVALIHSGEEFSNTLSYNGNTADRKFYTEGFNDYSYKSDFQEIDYLGNWKHSEMLSLVYGAEFQRDSMNAGDGDESRDQEGYFLEYQGGFADSLYLSAGARYTDNEDFGTKTTYRTGAAYLVTAGEGEFKFKATYGTGFRAPSLYEIAYNINFPPYSSEPPYGPLPPLPELGAEESEGYDAGVGYFATSGWYLDVVYFDQKVDNEIYFDLINYYGYLQGDGDTSSDGVEVTSEVPLDEMFTLTGNYTYTDTQDFDGEQRRRTPKNMGNIGLLTSLWDGDLQFNVNYRVARDIADETSGSVGDYEVLDLSVSYQVLESLQVYARVENATDEDYEEVPNYNTPGAAGYAGFRYTF